MQAENRFGSQNHNKGLVCNGVADHAVHALSSGLRSYRLDVSGEVQDMKYNARMSV